MVMAHSEGTAGEKGRPLNAAVEKIIMEALNDLCEQHNSENPGAPSLDEVAAVADFLFETLKKLNHQIIAADLVNMVVDLQLAIKEQKPQEASGQRYDARYRLGDEARKLHIRLFFRENRYTVDMSGLQTQIEDHKELLSKTGLLEDLCRYLDSEKSLLRVFHRVRNICPMTAEETDTVVARELERLYDEARKHIDGEIAKAGDISNGVRFG